jgi:hypothetical protein
VKKWICLLAAAFLLILPVRAVDVPKELKDALPGQAEELMEHTENTDVTSLGKGILNLLKKAGAQVKNILHER